MNTKLHLTLLFLISASLFIAGIYFTLGGVNLRVCEEYALVGEVALSDCYPSANAMWGSLALGILMFICLIFLTKKGWKKNESQ